MVRGFGWCVGGGYFDYWGGLLIIYYYLNDLLPLNSGTLSSFLREYSYRHNLLYQTFISRPGNNFSPTGYVTFWSKAY